MATRNRAEASLVSVPSDKAYQGPIRLMVLCQTRGEVYHSSLNYCGEPRVPRNHHFHTPDFSLSK